MDLCLSYLAADLGIMPSPNEGFGLSTIEELRHGLPVISRAIPPSQEIFSAIGSEPGVLVDLYDDRNAVHQSIEFLGRYAGDALLREELKQRAFQSREAFDPTHWAKKFVDFILN
jgi:glycosyltransferase involved in cell wall biosynthesis